MSFIFNSVSARERLVFGVLFICGVAAHIIVGDWNNTAQLNTAPAARMVVTSASFQLPSILPVLKQLAIALGLYAAAQALVWILARASTKNAGWYAQVCANLVWISASFIWLMLRANSALFPRSIWTWLFLPLEGPATIATDIAATIYLLWRVYATGAATFSYIRSHAFVPHLVRPRWLSAPAALILVIALSTWASPFFSPVADPNAGNIIVIGLDSMRRDIALASDSHLTPNLARFRDHAHVEANVISPLSRTFPAWVTMLTGHAPIESGARFNLVNQDQIRRDDTLAWDLHHNGYRTIYATDETRFSNIGPEFGFDRVISPAPGVADFVMGQIGDQPFLNLAAQIPYIEKLLPTLVGNRALATTYYPSTFNARLRRQLGFSKGEKTFLAIHLCLAHWPFYSAGSDLSSTDIPTLYGGVVAELDKQFGNILADLRRLRYLDDKTLVVVLADHGETIAVSDWDHYDTQIHDDATMPGWLIGGHGGNLLSAADRNVFVMFSGNAQGKPILPTTSKQLASLEDLRGTISTLAGLPQNAASTPKMAIADQYLGTSGKPNVLRSYVRVETGFRPERFDPLHPDPALAAHIAAENYQVSRGGKINLKPEAVEAALADKDYGFTDGETSLLIVRVPETSSYTLIVDNHRTSKREIYPANRRSDVTLPLLPLACADTELYPRIDAWCRD